jgi:hypothetical protein
MLDSMFDIVIMLMVLAAGFAVGHWLGLKRADAQLSQATKQLQSAIDIVKAFHANQMAIGPGSGITDQDEVKP